MDDKWIGINEWNTKVVKEFLKQGHFSKETVRSDESGLHLFFMWIKENSDNQPLYRLKPRDALAYQNYLIEEELSPATIRFRRSCVSSLCRYVEVYYREDFPYFRNIFSKGIPQVQQAMKNERDPLSPLEVEKLVNELKLIGEFQMVAYVMLTYCSGARRAEISQVMKEVIHYDMEEGKNHFLTNPVRSKSRGKRGEYKRLPFDKETMTALRLWIISRGKDDCPYLFVKKTKAGKVHPLHKATFNYWCQDIFSFILGKRVHPHKLRHSRATNLRLYDGVDIEAIQELLGHKSYEMTRKYIQDDPSKRINDIFS